MSGSHKYPDYVLGIDLGTTTVKVALVNIDTGEVARTKARATAAQLHADGHGHGNHNGARGGTPVHLEPGNGAATSGGSGSQGGTTSNNIRTGVNAGIQGGTAANNRNEQDPQRILTALQFCVSGLPKEELVHVRSIGISGQMHGVVLWKQGQGWSRNNFGKYKVETASALYTWQDGRCEEDFLLTLPTPQSHLKLASGLGCVTLFWLARHQPDLLEQYDCAGTIQDFVVAMLCDLPRPVMSVHNAASWGYYDTLHQTWNLDTLCEAGFPVRLLPSVQPPCSIAGRLHAPWYGVPSGGPVGVALGDLQCSIRSRLQHAQDAVLNISTSAQLAFQMLEGFEPPELDITSSIEYFPYFEGWYLAVAASLTGGNVMAAFVKMLQQWTHELGLGVPEGKIWERIQTLSEVCHETDLAIQPTIFGERHSPGQRATVTNITPSNTSLGSVFSALCKGVITNLHNMMSQDFLLAGGIKRIVGSGMAITKNMQMRTEIERQYKLPLVLCEGSHADAAVGVAMAMLEAKHSDKPASDKQGQTTERIKSDQTNPT